MVTKQKPTASGHWFGGRYLTLNFNTMATIIFSTDVSIEHSTLIVLDVDTNKYNNCIALQENEDGLFSVYGFDLLDTLNDWYDLADLESFTGQRYEDHIGKDLNFWAQFTNDVCSYYGAQEFDQQPQTMTLEELKIHISQIGN